ncbi:OmpL47-type beta-barrel domain-containing protein [Halorussus caseinilyticus]|uniref:OmpL47-type beta-barrel domain-containing protein n=2 Tax=Halorussus caseinilyticus TaxID=3034025 RepID=A0ABD5WNH0_9EURY
MHGVPTNADGMMEPPTSDGPGFEVTGDVDVVVEPPEGSSYRPNSTSLTVENDTGITVALRKSVSVSGSITEADGDPAVDDFVFVPAEGVQGQAVTYTDAAGNFSAAVPEGTGTYDVQYYQGNFTDKDGTYMPRDGSPDLYSVAAVDATTPTDLGTVALPNASVLNVTVTNETGAAVENASVSVTHFDGEATTGLGNVSTDAQGRMDLTPSATPPGVEVVGNVTVEVRPPENSTRYPNQTHVRNLTVTSDTEVGVTLDGSAPAVTAFDVVANGQDVDVRLAASERLAAIEVELGGDTSGTLTRSDFSLTNDSGTYVYRANLSEARDGTFDATLRAATDEFGHDGSSGESDSVTVDTTAPSLNATVIDAADGNGVVRDGDEVRIEATVSEDATSVANVTANATGLGVGFVTLAHESNDTYATAVTVTDADNGTQPITVVATDDSGNQNVTTESIVVDNVKPEISYFDISSLSDESILEVTLDSSERLTELQLNITNSNGTVVKTFTDLSRTQYGGVHQYQTTYAVETDGEYRATLVNASDAADNSFTGSATDNTSVDTTAPTVWNLTASEYGGDVTVSFDADERLNTSAVVAEVTNESGATVATLDSFQNGSDTGTVYWTQFTAPAGVEENWTITLTRAEDHHGLDGASGQNVSLFVDTAAPTVTSFEAAFAGDEVTATLTADERLDADETIVQFYADDGTFVAEQNVTALGNETYEAAWGVGSGIEENYTAELKSAVDTSGNDGANGETVAAFVDTAAPTVTNVSLTNPSGQTLNVRFDADESVTDIAVNVSGAANLTMTESHFSEQGGTYFSALNASTDGEFTVTLERAADGYGNDGATGQNASIAVDTTMPTVQNFSLSKEARDVDLSLASDERLSEIRVNLTGDEGSSLLRPAFDETSENGTYTYTADVSDGRDGTFSAQLNYVADGHGNAGEVSANAAMTVDTNAPEISNLSASANGRTVVVTFESNESLASIGMTYEGLRVTNMSSTRTAEGYEYRRTLEADEDGEHSASLVKAADAYGNDGADNRTVSVVVDTRAPNVSVHDVSDADDNEVVADGERVSVAIEASDGLSGVETVTADASEFGAGTIALNDSDGDGIYRGNFTVDAADLSDGIASLSVTAVDAKGNEEGGIAQQFLLDTRAPNTTHRLNGTTGDAGWYTSAVTVNLTASDGTSGVVQTEYRVDGGNWTAYDGNVTVAANGAHTVTYRSVDEGGNVEASESVSFDIDADAPVTNFTTNATANENGWYDSDVNVTLDATDSASGVVRTEYRVDGGNWTPYAGNITFTADGNYTVEFYSVDAAGNEEVRHNRTVRIDTQKPTVNGTPGLNRTREILPEHAIAVVVNATDDNGVAGVFVDGHPVGDDWAVPAASALGNHTFEVVVRDVAGNERVVTTGEYSVGQQVSMERRNDTFSAETNDTNVGKVAIETNETATSASVTVGTAKKNPEKTDPDGTSLYFPQINTTVSNANITDATVTVTVAQSRIHQKYIKDGTVKFWVEEENTSSGWRKVNATRIDTDDGDGTYTYEIEAPHFSTYAVTGQKESGAPNASLGVATRSPTAGDVTLTASYSDGYAGVDAENVTLHFEGADVTGAASVNDSDLRFTRNLTAGTYNATLFVTDNAGNSLSAPETVTFSVVNESSGGSGGGGSSGGGGGGANVPDPPAQVTVTDVTASSVRAEVVSARSDSSGDVSPEGGISAGDLTVRKVSLAPKSSEPVPRFLAAASVSSSAPVGASAPDGTTLGYLNVSATHISSSALGEVKADFAVPKSSVAAPENVAVFRLSGGSWQRVETKVVGETGGQYVVRAKGSATGVFAVGVRSGALSVTDASVGAESVAPGTAVEVTATVENTGDGTGATTARISVDGEVVAEKQVELGAGESETVTVEVTLDSPGAHDISVNGASAGSVSVAAETTTSEGDDTDETTAATTDDGGSGGIPGFGVSTALVALLAALVAARRRLR